MDKTELYNRISDRLNTVDLSIQQRMDVRTVVFEVFSLALDIEIINLQRELTKTPN